MKHLWFTDCNSLNTFLANRYSAGCEDKRFEVHLESQRQFLRENSYGTLMDGVDGKQTDEVRWIDSCTMIADPLTKIMKADRLVATLKTGKLDLVPAAASQMSKLMKQKQG